MHILLIDLGKEMRGGQWQVYYLARALARSGAFSPILAAPADAPLMRHAAALEGVRTLPLAGSREWDPRTLHAIRSMVHKEGVRVLHSHCAKSATLVGICKRLWSAKVLAVHSRRVSYPLKKGWRGSKYVQADAVVAVSREIADVMIASGMPENKVRVIHSGIDCARYEKRRQRGDGRIVVGMVGAFTPQKGHEVLVQALAELDRETGLPPWEVRMIGSGERFAPVATLAAELGVDAHMSMLGWQDSRDFLPDFDMLTVPSVDGEGSSATIKEAWAVGIPVVCSDLASNLELVTDGRNGLTFPNRDHAALASCLARLMRDAALCERLVRGGAETVREFTDERMAAAYMELYRSLAG